MLVNGSPRALEQPLSLAEFLKQEGYRQELVAVECNGVIIRRSAYGSTLVDNETTLEIVSFVGGG